MSEEAPFPARKLALFSPSLGGGGAERVMVTLANAMQVRGHDVDLVLGTATGPYLRDVNRAVRVVDLGAARALQSFLPLLNYLRTEKPAAMLSTLGQANVLAIVARKLAAPSMKLIVRETNTHTALHLNTPSIKQKLLGHLTPYAYTAADAIVAPSNGVAADLAELLPGNAPPLVVIPNPIEHEVIRRQAEERLHPTHSAICDPFILAVGRLNPQKDLPTLVAAFERVARARKLQLVLLGDGAEKSALRELLARRGLTSSVHMLGFVDNPFAFMRRAASYVLSSRFEGLPNALLQAIAVGTPVVATDCPSGPREILEGGRWGHLVRVGDHIAMANAITAVLDGDTRTMPQELFVARYGVEFCTDQYIGLIETI